MMHQTIVNITGMNAIVQSLLLAVFFILNKKGNRYSNRIFAAWLFAFGLVMFSTMPGASYKFGSYYKISFIMRRVAFVIAPLFYFYIQSCMAEKFRLRLRDVLHFTPFFILLVLTLFQALCLHVWKIPLINEYYVHTLAILVQNVIYIILAIRYLQKQYEKKLMAVMNQQKPFLRPDLSMADLARDTAMSVKHLSYVVNNALHSNFYDFVNRYRIAESKRLLSNHHSDRINILQIAYAVGFNSKSTFNAAFKKHTGMTPRQYRKQYFFEQKTATAQSLEPRYRPVHSVDC